MIALKARIGFKGDVEKQINTAVEKLEVSLPENNTPCTYCGSKGTLEATTGDFNFISGAIVKNVPVWKCKECDEILFYAVCVVVFAVLAICTVTLLSHKEASVSIKARFANALGFDFDVDIRKRLKTKIRKRKKSAASALF